METNQSEDRNEGTAMANAPPMSEIVVRRESSSVESNTMSGGLASLSTFSTPFRLQPRKPICKPSVGRGAGGSRGRKRTAQSMSVSAFNSSPAIVSFFGGSTPSSSRASTTAEDETSSIMLSSMKGTCEASVVPVVFSTPKDLPVAPEAPVFVTTPNLPTTPSRVEGALKTLQSLSLQSPTCFPLEPPQSKTNRLPTVSTTSPCASRMNRSSFTVYNASPVESLRSSTGSIGSSRLTKTPNSCKSSPKIAPLTVLKKNGSDEPLLSNNRTPQTRPPRHGGVSSMLFSLDSKSRHDAQYLASPKLPPSTVHCRRPSADSSIQDFDLLSPAPSDIQMKRSTPSSKRSFCTPSSKRSTGTPSSKRSNCTPLSKRSIHTPLSKRSGADEFVSPSKRSRSGASPRTPLPKVTLTPRSTSSRHSSRLPRFPSPSDVDNELAVSPPFLNTRRDEMNHRLPRKIDFDQPKSTKHPLLPGLSGPLGLPLEGKRGERNSLAPVSSTMSFPKVASPMTMEIPALPSRSVATPSASLPMASPVAAAPADKVLQKTQSSRTSDVVRRPLFKHKTSQSTVLEDSSNEIFLGIKTKSLLTPSQSVDMLESLMDSDRPSAGATGSISDIDDDDAFLLTAPWKLEEERQAKSQRARQRRRRSIERSSLNAQWSSISPSSHKASNSSLVGMSILHPPEMTTAASSAAHRFASIVSDEDQQSGLRCFKSGGSPASVGLTLDCTSSADMNDTEPNEECEERERDLVTPPPLPTDAHPSPPLTPNKQGLPGVGGGIDKRRVEGHQWNGLNFCVTGADRRSVALAIAHMAYNAEHKNSPVGLTAGQT